MSNSVADASMVGRTPLSTFLQVVQRAVKVWYEVGFDRSRWLAHERLGFDGAPCPGVPQRCMVQARQLHVFSRATAAGLIRGADELPRFFEALVRAYYRADGVDGWLFSVTSEGSAIDQRRDTYSHAFLLFALAAYFSLTGDPRARDIAFETVDFMNEHLRASSGDYFLTGRSGENDIISQNPHMHLLEAMLEWIEILPDERFYRIAEDVIALSHDLFRPEGVLVEFVDARRGRKPVGEGVWEPGHQYEWIWLLGRCRAFADVSHIDWLCATMKRHAQTLGHAEDGTIFDEVTLKGAVRKTSSRLWTYTEAIKALREPCPSHSVDRVIDASRMAEILLERYLDRPFQGGWHDHLDANRVAFVDYVPASSLYHLNMAAMECTKFQEKDRGTGTPRSL